MPRVYVVTRYQEVRGQATSKSASNSKRNTSDSSRAGPQQTQHNKSQTKDMEPTLRDLIPNASQVARTLGLSYNTVNNWILNNAVPPKRARVLADALDVELRELLQFVAYSKNRAPAPIIKSEDELEQLYLAWRGLPYDTSLPEKSVQLTLSRWGSRFGLLYKTLHKLKGGEITVTQATKTLDVSKSTVHGLRRRYGMAPGKTKAVEKLSKKEQKVMEGAVLDTISARFSAVAAAKEHNVNLRTLHRHIAPALEPLTLNELAHWPNSFRRALAWEIRHTQVRLSPVWLAKAREMRLVMKKNPKWPAMPRDARKAPIRELMVQWLGGEALELLAIMRRGEPAILKGLFEQELANFGIYGIESLSSYHRSCAGEILIAFMSPFRSRVDDV